MLDRRNALLLALAGLLAVAAGGPACADSGSGGGDNGGGDGGGGDDGGGDDDGGDDDGGDDVGVESGGSLSPSSNVSGGGEVRSGGGKASTGKSGEARLRDQKQARDAVKNGKAAALKDILKSVRGRFKGEVVDVRLRGKGDNLTYRVKMVDESGKLIVVSVDARTRKIVKVSGL